MTDETSLDEVWLAACPDPIGPWDDIWTLHRAGVPLEAMHDRRGNVTVGADDIAIVGTRWERRFQGHRAIILAAVGPAGDCILDLVAFRLETPKSFWCMRGGVPLLGFDSLERAEHETRILRFDDLPPGEAEVTRSKAILTVHESPLEWLKAGRQGICILERDHYWPAYLGDVVGIKAANETHGRRLADLLDRPLPRPPVLVAA